MLHKSIRLFETDRAKTLLAQVEANESQASSPGPKTSGENVRRRKKSPDLSSNQSEPNEAPREYTPAQAEVVNRILQCKSDYYKILGLEKGATEDEVKKAYRKLALKLHPDKNQAPRADEAFKMLGKAFAVLSDKDKRDSYEQYGADGPQLQQRGGGGFHHHGGFYDDDGINPEEIFNMFFGGGIPTGHRMHRGRTHFRFHHGGGRQHHHDPGRHRHRRETHESQNNLGVWLQFMPLLVLIGLSLISNLMTPDPIYSLHRYPNRGYATRINTEKDRIPYYVKSDYVQEFPPQSAERRKVEAQVRSEFIENLRINCYQETLNAEQKMRRAQLYRDSKMMEQAKQMARPNCNRLDELNKNGG